MRGRLPVIGTYTGSAAAQNFLNIGFRPKKIEIYNTTDGFKCGEFVDGMADASYFKYVAAGTQTNPTTNGITLGADGFTVGSDAGINTNAKAYTFICY